MIKVAVLGGKEFKTKAEMFKELKASAEIIFTKKNTI